MSEKKLLKTAEQEVIRLYERVMKDFVTELDKTKSNSDGETFSYEFCEDRKKLSKVDRLYLALMASIYCKAEFKQGNYENFFKYYNYGLQYLSKSRSIENISDFKTELGKANAAKRHVDTYRLKREAIEYWKENIDPKLSNDDAAEILTKIVPVKFRTLSRYVSEAKKELQPASQV